jgi:hypothetical protein
MRPARIAAAVVFAAAVAVTGCAAHPTAAPPAAPVTPAAAPPAPTPPTPKPPVDLPKPPTPRPPVLTDGHYDSYVRTVDTRHNRLVVDLVQVFHDQAAVDAAVADGTPHDQAQVLSVWVRNHNPRLRTLPMARDLHLDLLPGDCVESRNHQFAKLVRDSRAVSGSRPAYYFTLTVAGGVVHRIQEDRTFNAC